jgi:hypothetical protein
MSDRKRNILESAERIGFFGEANPQLATELPSTVQSFAANQNNITRLHQAGITSASSGSAMTSGTRSKVARAAEIVADLRRVAKSAKQIEKKHKDFKNIFTLPRSGLTYQEIIEHADSVIADAPDNKAYFDKLALTEAFFSELGTSVDEFRGAAHDQADAHRTVVGATADTESILEDTLDTREELDIALRNHYRDNPQKLAEWLTASHIERKKRRTGDGNSASKDTPSTVEEK